MTTKTQSIKEKADKFFFIKIDALVLQSTLLRGWKGKGQTERKSLQAYAENIKSSQNSIKKNYFLNVQKIWKDTSTKKIYR